jgi:hypothetical protein
VGRSGRGNGVIVMGLVGHEGTIPVRSSLDVPGDLTMEDRDHDQIMQM